MSFKLSALAWKVEVEKSADRLVLLALASKADDDGRNCFPSIESICGLTVLNRKTVFAVISRLADRGLITVRKRANTNSNEYQLHVDRWSENGSTENGTTQKWDIPKAEQQSSQKRDDGSTENGTTVVPKTGHYSINTQSDTQSTTQSESLPAQAPWESDHFDNTVKKIEEPKPKRTTTDRGSRLTITELPDDWKAFAEQEEPDLDPKRLFENFKDYWNGLSGAKAIKKDWKGTWRNFVRSFHNAEDWKRRPMLKQASMSFGFNKPTDPQHGIGVCQPPAKPVRMFTREEALAAKQKLIDEGLIF